MTVCRFPYILLIVLFSAPGGCYIFCCSFLLIWNCDCRLLQVSHSNHSVTGASLIGVSTFGEVVIVTTPIGSAFLCVFVVIVFAYFHCFKLLLKINFVFSFVFTFCSYFL